MTDFEWPWEYTFPPFFTLQVHEETRNQQLNVWAELFLKYLKHLNKFTINVNDSDFALFNNESIKRRISPELILLILEQLQRTAHAAPIDKRRMEWQVYWHTLEEYAAMIYDWVQNTGQMNSVCTLFELTAAENTEFQNIDESVLLSALKLLEDRGKCELIEMDGSHGVKFF